MKRKILAIISMLILLTTTAYGTSYTTEQDKLYEEKQTTENGLNQTKIEKEKIEKEIEEIDGKMKVIVEELSEAEKENTNLAEDIENNKTEIKKTEKKLNKKDKELRSRLDAMYLSGGGETISYLEIILNSEDIVDLFSRFEAIKDMVEYDSNIISKVKEYKSKVKKIKNELAENETILKGKLKTVIDKKSSLEAVSNSKTSYVSNLENDEQLYEEHISNLEKESQKIIEKIAEEEKIAQEMQAVKDEIKLKPIEPKIEPVKEAIKAEPVKEESKEELKVSPVKEEPKEEVKIEPVKEESKEELKAEPVKEESKEELKAEPVKEEPKEEVKIEPVREESKEELKAEPVKEEPKEEVKVEPVKEEIKEEVKVSPVKEEVKVVPVKPQEPVNNKATNNNTNTINSNVANKTDTVNNNTSNKTNVSNNTNTTNNNTTNNNTNNLNINGTTNNNTSNNTNTSNSKPPAIKQPSGMIRPTSGGSISSEFGGRWGRNHNGIDIAVSTGTPVYASSDGVVASSNYSSSYGEVIFINHGNGIVTVYAHNSRRVAQTGKSVKKGEIIAYSGNTGRSTGPHVHFEVLVNGTKVNPRNYVNF